MNSLGSFQHAFELPVSSPPSANSDRDGYKRFTALAHLLIDDCEPGQQVQLPADAVSETQSVADLPDFKDFLDAFKDHAKDNTPRGCANFTEQLHLGLEYGDFKKAVDVGLAAFQSSEQRILEWTKVDEQGGRTDEGNGLRTIVGGYVRMIRENALGSTKDEDVLDLVGTSRIAMQCLPEDEHADFNHSVRNRVESMTDHEFKQYCLAELDKAGFHA